MSHKLYSTGLFYEDGRGWAKLHGILVYLFRPPLVGGVEPCGIDYVPEVGRRAIIVIRRGKWVDMTRPEILAADEFLLTLIGGRNGK